MTRRCYFCRKPYRRRDLVEVWVDVTKPADQGGKVIVKAGAACGCSSVARLLEAVRRRPRPVRRVA